MTITDIKNLDKDTLIPADVASLFPTDPHSIRIQAREDPDALGFPVSVIGTRTYIPRLGFINWWLNKKEESS